MSDTPEKHENFRLFWPRGGSYSGPAVNFKLNEYQKEWIKEFIGESYVSQIEMNVMFYFINKEFVQSVNGLSDNSSNLDNMLILAIISNILESLLNNKEIASYLIQKSEELYGSRFTKLFANYNSQRTFFNITKMLNAISFVCGAVNLKEKRNIFSEKYYLEIEFLNGEGTIKLNGSEHICAPKKKRGRPKNSKDWALYELINKLIPICESSLGRSLTIINKDGVADNLLAKLFRILLPSIDLPTIPTHAINSVLRNRSKA